MFCRHVVTEEIGCLARHVSRSGSMLRGRRCCQCRFGLASGTGRGSTRDQQKKMSDPEIKASRYVEVEFCWVLPWCFTSFDVQV